MSFSHMDAQAKIVNDINEIRWNIFVPKKIPIDEAVYQKDLMEA